MTGLIMSQSFLVFEVDSSVPFFACIVPLHLEADNSFLFKLLIVTFPHIDSQVGST